MSTPNLDQDAARRLRERVAYEIKCAAYNQPLMGVDWSRVENQRWLDVADRIIAQAQAEEREWWLDMLEDEYFPCVAAGAPKGSCRHESYCECLLDADSRRRVPTGGPRARAEGDAVKKIRIPRTWNPKRLGVKVSPNCPGLETDVWCYIMGGKLSVIVQVNKDGMVLGQTTYHDAARLPRGSGG